MGLALALLVVGAVDTTVLAELRNENRVAIVPVVGDTEMTLGTELTPALTFTARTRTSELGLNYGPQILYAVDTDQTIVLHRANAGVRHALTRDLSLHVTSTGAIGELDFYRARRLLDPERGEVVQLPDNTVVGYATGQVEAGAAGTVGRWMRWEVSGTLGHTGPRSRDEPISFFREQDSAGLTARLSRQLGRGRSLGLEAERNWVWFAGGPYYDGVTPAAFYTQTLGRGVALNARAGVLTSATRFGAAQLRDWSLVGGLDATLRGTERRYLPVADVSVDGPWLRGAGVSARGRVTANLLAAYDPVRGTLSQRAVVAAASDFTLPHSLMARTELAFYAPVDLELTRSRQEYADEDLLATLNAVFTSEIQHGLDLEWGVLATERFADYTAVASDWSVPEVVLRLGLVFRTEVL